MKIIINEDLAELTGIMFGDGCLSQSGSKHLIYISGHKVDDFEYHSNIVKKLFKKVFNKDTTVQFRKNENTLFIRFSDKDIFNIFHSFGLAVGIKYADMKVPLLFKEKKLFTAFLRGLFDTDGCMVLSKQHKQIPYYPRLEITSKSKSFLIEILEMLRGYGFYGSVSNKGRSYRLELPGFRNLFFWRKLISSKNPKHTKKFEHQN